jgi:hypothetical protein
MGKDDETPQQFAERITKQNAKAFATAAGGLVAVQLGERVLDLFARQETISIEDLMKYFQAEIDGFTGSNPDVNFKVLMARAVIDRLRGLRGPN